jgi:L-ascorbate metabolism protein UlaG (beta-lactamase superfamily)
VNVRLTWYGHATVLVDDQVRALTDPVLTASLAHLHRRAGLVPEGLVDSVDVVLVSHLHADHLHLPSLALLPRGTPVVVPRGAARLLRRLPVEPVEVVAGEDLQAGGARIRVVPAVHDGRRWPWSRARGDALGYVVCGRGATYFAGDTSLFPGMADLHPDLDVALMPVGGWGPWLRGHHLNPRTAAECLPLIGARVSVPIHYGTLWPRGLSRVRPHVFHDPGRDFADHARRVAPAVDVRVLHPGSSTSVVPRTV